MWTSQGDEASVCDSSIFPDWAFDADRSRGASRRDSAMTQSLGSVDGSDSETNAGSTTGTSAVRDWSAMVLVLQDPAPKTFGVRDVAGTAVADDEVSEVMSTSDAGPANTVSSSTGKSVSDSGSTTGSTDVHPLLNLLGSTHACSASGRNGDSGVRSSASSDVRRSNWPRAMCTHHRRSADR